MSNVLGYIAGTLTTLAFLPQALKAFRTKSTADMSLVMWLLLSTGVGCWLVYGILLRSGPIIVANAVTLIFSATILLLKLIHG